MMLYYRSNPLYLVFLTYSILLLCLLISSTFDTLSHGSSHLQEYSRISDRRKSNGDVDTRRMVAEINPNNSSVPPPPPSAVLILAQERTRRRDPSNGFKYYTGGWNITDTHYLYSVGFSAAPPLIVGAIWFILFGLFLLFIIIRFFCCRCCCRRRRDPDTNVGYSRTVYAISLSILILFTLATIAGCAISYVAQGKLENNIVSVTSYVLHQADTAFCNFRNLLNNLLAAKKIGVAQLTLSPEIQADIDDIGIKVNSYADKFHNVTANSTNHIRSFLEPVRLSLICVAAALLLLALLGFLISICGWKCIIYSLTIIGWILVTATFILCAMFLLIHNAVDDTCVAMDEWLQNPNADSALENIIPRVDNATAQRIFQVTKGVTYGVVQVVDGAIARIYNANVQPNSGPLYYNQSGPPMPLLCNPYNPDLTDRQCAPGEVYFTNASEIWSKYVCQVSPSGICTTPGRVTPDSYNDITATVNVSYGLYKESPFLIDLIDSTFIKETFASIRQNNCPGLIRYSKLTYAGFITASVAVMLSLLTWIVLGRQRRRRREAGPL